MDDKTTTNGRGGESNEVHILEEHVTRAAQKPISPNPVQPTPPSPSVLQAIPTAAPPPTSIPEAPIPIAPSLQLNVGESGVGNDIAKILADVKLPERHEAVASGERHVAVEEKKFDTSIVGSVATSPANNPAQDASAEMPTSLNTSQDEPKEAQKNSSSVTAVHTLKDDLQNVVHDQKISLVRAVSLEEDRRAHKAPESIETPGTKQRSKRTLGTMFAALILLGLGAAALFGVAFIMNQQRSPPQIDTGSSILFAEQSVLLSIDAQSPGELKRMLEAGGAASQGTLGSITRIIPVTAAKSADGTIENRAATFKEFMAAIGAHPPDDLLRALENDFFLGIHAVDKSAPILVIPVTSHDHAFEAMLNWEESLNIDLAPAFSPVPVLTRDKNGLPVKRVYNDLVMRNYDVRALKDDAGTIQLYYSFPTQNILVIAESPYSFPEILSRLQASRKL